MFNPDFNLDVPTGARYFPSAGSPTSSRQRPDRRHRGVEEGFRRMNGRGRGERTRSPTFGTHRHHPDHEENHPWLFGINRAQIIGRLGADVTVNHLASGGRVANLSIATDESYINRHTGEKVDKTEWHRVVTFQDGLIDMFERHAVKGRLVYVEGKLQTRRWSKPGEDGDRFSTEILLVPGGRVQFLDLPNGNGAAQASDAQAMPDAAVAAANGAAAPADLDSEIPF